MGEEGRQPYLKLETGRRARLDQGVQGPRAYISKTLLLGGCVVELGVGAGSFSSSHHLFPTHPHIHRKKGEGKNIRREYVTGCFRVFSGYIVGL